MFLGPRFWLLLRRKASGVRGNLRRPGGVYIRRWQLYMTPKTRHETVTSVALRSQETQSHTLIPSVAVQTFDQMTLCGSEVPQDRWRGRTAGSGMWTLTRDNLLSWSLDDPAITYG